MGVRLPPSAFLLSDVQSDSFGVASTPAQLTVTEQPSLAGKELAIGPPLVVEVQDVMGTRVAGDNETVVNPQLQGIGSLSGGDAEGVQAEEGRVTFEDLRVDTPQLDATLQFVADDLSEDTTEPFDVVGDGVALELVSETVPLNQHQESTVNMIVDADAPMVLMIVDANELPVFFDDTTEVSASLKPESGDPDATLSGTLTVTAEEGVVAFDDLSIDLPGDDYVLEFSAPGLIGVQTQPFAIYGDQPVDDDLSEEEQYGEESGTAEGCSSSCMSMRTPGDMTWLFIALALLAIVAAGRRRSANA